MFNSKLKTLSPVDEQNQRHLIPITNQFLQDGLKKSAVVASENGAKKYSTTGNTFIDQFGKTSEYKSPRNFDQISQDMSALWAINPLVSIMFIIYLRIITRVVVLLTGEKTSSVQRGAGLRHESILRMIWLQLYHPDSFWKNIGLFISAGSWRDIIYMLSYDLQYNGWKDRKLDWKKMGDLLLTGLTEPSTTNLVRKYLPQIKANSQCKTIEAQADNLVAKWICSLIFGGKVENSPATYALYRKYKVHGTAHQWQQLISQGKHNLVDFSKIAGRALSLLVSSKYLKNQGLETKYSEWISGKAVAKYTGFPHELFLKPALKVYQQQTVNAQFMQLVETAKKGTNSKTSLIVVRDTSSSMGCAANGVAMSCANIGKALALFFSYMLPDGAFANAFIEFNSDAKLHTWKGSTPYEKWNNDSCNYYGSTNFQSVIRLLVKSRQNGVPESEFPTGILCISDGEFNPSDLNKTNVESALTLLRTAFSPGYVENFKIVLWNLAANRQTSVKFETYGDVENVFYFSGYEASIVAFLTGLTAPNSPGTPSTAEELFDAVMNQELLQYVQV